MKKTCFLAVAITAALIGGAVVSLVGCGETTPPSGWKRFDSEQLSAGEVRINEEDGSAFVRWKEEKGVAGYYIYRSKSRFGTYEKVSSELVTGCRYEATDHVYDYYKIMAVENGQEKELGVSSAFSDNTLVVSPTDDMEAVQRVIDETHTRLEKGSVGQFSSERFALFLLPGDYPLTVRLGYYTAAYGLGEVPTDVTVKELYVSTNVLSNNNSTCTFWRSAENFTVKSNVQFAVSQATSMRRMQINGNLALSHPSGWSSGGFLANSNITGSVDPGTQQQWFSRNDNWGSFLNNGGSHNLVFSGCTGKTPASAWSDSKGRYTNLEYTEKIAEKPYLFVDEEGEYRVFIPAVEENVKGVTWLKGQDEEAGKSVPLGDFYLANAKTDDDKTLNGALKRGENVLLTPGNYNLKNPLNITVDDTVFLGTGYATLQIDDTNSVAAVQVGEVGGVRFGDLLIDAGFYSKNMMVVGKEGSKQSYAENPVVLSNLYLRIGGKANVHTETEDALVIHSNDTIGDNFWLWRADHSSGVAWEDETRENGETSYGNPVETGLRVCGDNVRCYALMVEHTEGYQTYWEGENGLTVMYQSETPYRVPEQSAWMSQNGTKKGCASYKVADGVKKHRAFGIGIYLVNYSGVELDSAIEVPESEGIEMTHLVICSFAAQNGSKINNVVNGTGGWVGEGSFRRLVEKYPKS